jgi:hypothetical protein
MQPPDVHSLAYASPGAKAGRWWFRPVLVGIAVLGLAANGFFICVSVETLDRASWAYHELVQNPRAYGRLVDPATVASLREPVGLRLAHGAFVVAAAFGMLLAVDLLAAARLLDRRPGDAARRLARYRRVKPFGAALTAASFFACSVTNQLFWEAATRHSPVGGGPPVLETAALLGFALLPCAWIPKDVRQTGGGD